MVKNIHGQLSLSRRERKKAEVRGRLFSAAIRLFREQGFDETPVEVITEEADTSKGTFFNYFPTKEHVLVAYHEQMMERLLVRLRGLREVNSEEAIRRAMEICADWVEADRRMGRIIVSKIFGNVELLAADRDSAQRFATWFEEQVVRGIEAGRLRADLDREAFLAMLAAILSSTFNDWVMDPDGFDLRDMLERKTELLLRAARTSQGERR